MTEVVRAHGMRPIFADRTSSLASRSGDGISQRIAITGGSGFIGTNLLDFYLANGAEALVNWDVSAPRDPQQGTHWRQVDLCDEGALSEEIAQFRPDVLFHLGARTDLFGDSVSDYTANVNGVKNLISAVHQLAKPPKIIFASSRLVCRIGYQPNSEEDYCPANAYGESKVVGERLVRELAGDLEWIIVRPTSIWGPWFRTPYRDFFETISQGRYVHPYGKRIRKSFGFVGNTAFELDRLMFGDSSAANRRTIYLADYPAVELHDWANEVARHMEKGKVRSVPVLMLRSLAKLGDAASAAGMKSAPLTSFRLNNLLTDMIHDTKLLEEIAGALPFSLSEATSITVNWLKSAPSTKEWKGIPRLLVAEKHFVEGYGGTPESVLLLANQFKGLDIVVDVLSCEGLHPDVGRLTQLPREAGEGVGGRDKLRMRDYGAVFIAGSWNPRAIRLALQAKALRKPISYAAKGNLCAVEFTRPRDLKKLAYLATLEIVPLILSDKWIFSSELEKKYSLLPPRLKAGKGVVIPEPFRVPAPTESAVAQPSEKPASLTFGFLAEISPRKGLLELVEGFLSWCTIAQHESPPTLRIAGDPRPGSEGYLEKAKALAQSHSHGNCVIWESGKRGDDRTDFYRELDVFVCPSRFESFGLTPLEALWEGTPVLCGGRIGFLEHLAPSPGLVALNGLTAPELAAGLEHFHAKLAEARHCAQSSKAQIVGAFAGDRLVRSFAGHLMGSA